MAEDVASPHHYPPDWRIDSVRQIADTIVGTVFDVTRADGTTAVVKHLKPKVLQDSLRGADFMAWRDGIGCVRLLARHGDMLLMEHAGTVTLRDHLEAHGDADATRIAAAVLKEYHQSSDMPPPESLWPLPRYFASLFKKAEHDRLAGPAGPFIEAALIAEDLLPTSGM